MIFVVALSEYDQVLREESSQVVLVACFNLCAESDGGELGVVRVNCKQSLVLPF